MDDITIDALTGAWTIAQRVRGHRHSTDDLLTGWYAAEVAPDPRHILDLGDLVIVGQNDGVVLLFERQNLP